MIMVMRPNAVQELLPITARSLHVARPREEKVPIGGKRVY